MAKDGVTLDAGFPRTVVGHVGMCGSTERSRKSGRYVICGGSVRTKGVGVEGLRKPASLHLRLQAKPESALVLRERLGLWLEELGASGHELYDISLAASEAFVNAVEHPHEPSADVIEVDGGVSDHSVSIVIHDFGLWRDGRQREEGGYGFPLMRRLMDAVRVETGLDGTSVTLRRHIGGQW